MSSNSGKPKKKKSPEKITKNSNLGQLIYRHPETVEVITDYGLHCVGCFASSFDTIEAGAKVHGMSDEEIAELVDRLNEVIEYKE